MSQLQVWIRMQIWRKCRFRHAEVDGQPSKTSKKSGVKGSVVLLKESTQLGCVSQDSHPSKSILRKGKMARGTTSTFGKERVHRKDPCAPRFADEDTRRNFATRKMRQQSSMVLGEKVSPSSQIRIKLRFIYSLLKPGQCWRPLQKFQRNETSWLTPEHQCTCWAKRTWAQENWMETLRRSRTPATAVTPKVKCKQTEKQRYMFTNWISSWLQVPEDTLASLGPAVKSHTSPNKGRRFSARRKMSYLLLSLDCRQILVPVRPLHPFRRTHQVHLQVQQLSEVTMEHQETGAIHPKNQKQK